MAADAFSEAITVSVIVIGATVLLEIMLGVSRPLMILTKLPRVFILSAGIIVALRNFLEPFWLKKVVTFSPLTAVTVRPLWSLSLT
ncbi:hypothetical protein [Candidatus Wolbachia massiliensis]|uniref:Uncharacterized protein n=1 Tax=Candidatus Wolbachia massiliensis TaxID=1845000 RepID=A0A7M3U262_9RICK|nr:hypothetical protein [Candidatus Wolbachia massiliensis]QOD38497.1 hypothetical protein ID128_01160 [Candidatus Wolbachia massiliensis]